MKKVCKRCGCDEIREETDEELKNEYPYYCPECDENMYSFEVEEMPETMEEHKHRIIRYLAVEDYLPLNAWVVRSLEGALEAINELLKDGIIRMRNCEASAVELNTVE